MIEKESEKGKNKEAETQNISTDVKEDQTQRITAEQNPPVLSTVELQNVGGKTQSSPQNRIDIQETEEGLKLANGDKAESTKENSPEQVHQVNEIMGNFR